MDVQQARRRFVLPVRIDRSRGENNRQYAVRLFRSWRDLEIPRVLTHREAADLLEVQRGFTSFSTLYPSGQVPLSSVAVLASKRKA